MSTEPPDHIDLAGGVTVRKEVPSDAAMVAQAIGDDLDRLARWLDWATPESATISAQLARIADAHQRWTAAESFSYIIVDALGTVLGKIALRERLDSETFEIGYWVTTAAEGQGVITAATASLTEAAFALDGVHRLVIRCDEANARSAAVPQRLNYRLERVVADQPATAPGMTGRIMVWSLTKPQVTEPAGRPPSRRADLGGGCREAH